VLGIELFVRLIGIGAAKADVHNALCGHDFSPEKKVKLKRE
jgi:hypothetical protein